MRYQGISIDWTSSGPRLYYSQLEGEREDSGEKYYSNGFAYLPASLSKEEVTAKHTQSDAVDLAEAVADAWNSAGEAARLRAVPAPLDCRVRSAAIKMKKGQK